MFVDLQKSGIKESYLQVKCFAVCLYGVYSKMFVQVDDAEALLMCLRSLSCLTLVMELTVISFCFIWHVQISLWTAVVKAVLASGKLAPCTKVAYTILTFRNVIPFCCMH